MKNREYEMLGFFIFMAGYGSCLHLVFGYVFFTLCYKSYKTKKRLQNYLETLFVVHPQGSYLKYPNIVSFSDFLYYCKGTDNFFITQIFWYLFLIFIRFKNRKTLYLAEYQVVINFIADFLVKECIKAWMFAQVCVLLHSSM